MTDILLGGPYDGLAITAIGRIAIFEVPFPSFQSSYTAIYIIYPNARYIRARDGRLHYEYSNWDHETGD